MNCVRVGCQQKLPEGPYLKRSANLLFVKHTACVLLFIKSRRRTPEEALPFLTRNAAFLGLLLGKNRLIPNKYSASFFGEEAAKDSSPRFRSLLLGFLLFFRRTPFRCFSRKKKCEAPFRCFSRKKKCCKEAPFRCQLFFSFLFFNLEEVL